MHSCFRVNNDVDAVEEHVELLREYTEELLHHWHVEEVVRFIILCEEVGRELFLRVEHDSVLATHQPIGYGTPDGRSEPITKAVHFIDTLLVRQVRLHKQFDILETFESKCFTHTRLIVSTEESVRVSAFLAGLELAEYRVL